MKQAMKKGLTVVMVLVMAAALLTGCGKDGGSGDQGQASQGETFKVGILQLMEHPSLNTIRESIIEGLADAGYVEGENLEIDYKNGQNDMTNMKTIAQTFVSGGCDVIVAIATPAAQAVMSETTDIPIIFAAVTDPVDAGLVEDLNNPGGNVSGTSDEVSAEAIMNLANEITPEFKTIGALYTSEVQQAAQYLADKVDIVYSPIDNTVASAMAVVTEVCNKAKIPFYVSADSMVQDGGLATYGIDYTVLGKETGKMVAEIFGGADVSAMPVVKMSDMTVYVNTKTADAIGVDLPQSVRDKATVLE